METQVEYLHLQSGGDPPVLTTSGPLKAVVVVNDAVEAEWREVVSDWLVRLRCLYMMAWGRDCSLWDDSVDHAVRKKFNFAPIPEEQFVMTTWHEHDSLEQVFWYSQFCAYDPHTDLLYTLILDIGPVERRSEFLKLFEQSSTLAEREP